MKRSVMYLIILGIGLSVCGKLWGALASEVGPGLYEIHQTSYEEGEEDGLQRDLVRWYNLNLRCEQPDRGFQGAYRSILCLDDGSMGYAEFPGLGLAIPIYHDGAEHGLVHRMDSPIPDGDSSHQTVLVCWEPVRLQGGDRFVICMMGQRMIYQVGFSSEDRCTLICGNASYACGRVWDEP